MASPKPQAAVKAAAGTGGGGGGGAAKTSKPKAQTTAAPAATANGTPSKTLAPSKTQQQMNSKSPSAAGAGTAKPKAASASSVVGGGGGGGSTLNTGSSGGRAEPYEFPTMADLWRPHVESFDWMLGHPPNGRASAVASLTSAARDREDTDMIGRENASAAKASAIAGSSGVAALAGVGAAASVSGLELAVNSLTPQWIDPVPEHKLPSFRFFIESATVGTPTKSRGEDADLRLFPHECRELGITYEGPLHVNVVYSIDNGPLHRLQRKMGSIPIMVKSARCHLKHLSRSEMLYHKEEENEQGGYFIMNGIERIIRLLIVNRRNHVTAITRSTYANRGKDYSKFGCFIRCVRPDQSAQTITAHYLESGSCTIRFTLRKNEYFVPAVLLLRALIDTTDKEIYDSIVQRNTANTFLTDRAEIMIRDSKRLILHSRSSVLAYLGNHFRIQMRVEASMTDERAGEKLIDDFIFVHCINTNSEVRNRQKYELLIYMIRKLYALVQGEIKPDNPDALSSHEILLPGHLYNIYLKEKLQDWLNAIKDTITRDIRMKPQSVEFGNQKYLKKVMDSSGDVCKAISSWIVTGNLMSKTGLDLQQVTGYTIVADKLNFFRYLSHFRSIHRGQFFAEQKTTTPRKLLPESWGFLCPVHTPDGAPCGLLNHLAAACEVITHNPSIDKERLIKLFGDLGMLAARLPPVIHPHTYLVVMMDGIVVGHVPPNLAHSFVNQLRYLKVLGHRDVPRVLEIAAVYDMLDGIFPGIYLYTTAARMVRPVYNITTKPARLEYIGSMEQMFLEVACTADDFRENETTHQEIAPTQMLSAIAGFTPFSDFNQSPRNMYQCQMGKQTMGTPFHSFPHRVDNKFYRLQNPQRPLVRNQSYARFGMDDYPIGTNAVVAVISYTGYDMEDAMILNKSSCERGFGHASIYTYKPIDLSENRDRGQPITLRFNNTDAARKPKSKKTSDLDWDGLPYTGQVLEPDSPMYAAYDSVTQRHKLSMNKGTQDICYVDEVRLLGPKTDAAPSASGDESVQEIGLKLRFNRNPLIGDKFCLSSHDTQLLTTDGWKFVHELTPNSLIACLADDGTGAMRYDRPSGIFQFDHTGPMYEVQSDDIDLQVTLNHRMWTKRSANDTAFKLRPASDLVGCVGVQYQRHASAGVDFAATVIVSGEHLQSVAQSLFVTDKEQFRISSHKLRLPEWVWRLSLSQSAALLTAIAKPSSNIACSTDLATLHGVTIRCRSSLLADDVQRLALHAGCSANIATPSDCDDELVCVTLNTANNFPTISSTDRQRIVSSMSGGHRSVFCVEVPSHIFYVRRGGKPCWTGNSSRHGQKGVLSVLWPQEDMPFTDSGMSPDIIINPHAFPSRMTIGMLVESLAGKSGALHGMYQDGTPFRYNEKQRAVDYFGEQLAAAGYNYYGTETLYSGISGVALEAEIYIGVVYYQRLRHMVSDKYQVRATGPVNSLHRQPIKGRKRHGGIRFGEMERDSLIAHGAAFLLNDRLMNCSDYDTSFVCTKCGSLLSAWTVTTPASEKAPASMRVQCRMCQSSRHCATVAMPYVFKYLANELAAMNIRLNLDVK